MQHFFDIAFTPGVRARQRAHGSIGHYPAGHAVPPDLGTDEAAFLTERDSVYVASVGEDGWPYVQHRGGHAGFIRLLGPSTIGWLERPGNRQYVTAGHLDADSRIALIAVDYPSRRRLKVYGRATYHSSPPPHLLEAFGDDIGRIDGVVTVDVVATDWNCPKFITPRYTADEIRAAVEPLNVRIRQLEAELATVRAEAPSDQPQLAGVTGVTRSSTAAFARAVSNEDNGASARRRSLE
jgi:hypothetical protein